MNEWNVTTTRTVESTKPPAMQRALQRAAEVRRRLQIKEWITQPDYGSANWDQEMADHIRQWTEFFAWADACSRMRAKP